jgi:ribonuclease-3|tara:strand:+ start:14379 stop:15035 length:657 start_codon:yes stop_codon:yes gene_type:complete
VNLKDLELTISYSFTDQELLETAFQHKSFNKNTNNERLEFLGDSILNSVIAEYLFINFPNYQEGVLTRARALLVKGSSLTKKANEIKLDEIIKLSKGMINLSDDRKFSLLEGAFEALIGAIFIDGGWDDVKKVIYQIYQNDFNNLSLDNDFKDPKSLLQEAMQAKGITPPDYHTEELKDQRFKSSLELKGNLYSATGKSKKSAETKLAENILNKGDFI